MECRVFENFQKKLFQNSKNAQKSSQKYPNVFCGDFFEKKLCPVFHGGSSFRKFQNFFFKNPKMPKIFPKSIQTCFECVLRQTFRKIFAQFSTAGRVFEIFQKNQKNFKKSKNAQNRSQKSPNAF